VTFLLQNRNFLFGFFSALFLVCINRAVVSEEYYFIAIPFAALLFYAGWGSINLVFLLLMFSLPFSIEYQFSESLGTDFPDEFLMIFVSVLVVCHAIYRPQILDKMIWRHPLIVLLLLSVVWAIVSVLFSTQPLVSIKFLLAKGWYIGAFVLAPLIVFREKQMIHKAVTIATIAMIIVTIIVLFRHAFDGFTFATINDALHPFFRNHVNYSAMLVCFIPVVFLFARTVRSKPEKVIAGCILVILLAALFLSYARGAWLALLVGIVTAWLIRKRLLVLTYITVIILLIGSLFWIKHNDRYLQYAHDYKTTIWHENFKEHLKATYELKDASTAERFYYNYKPYAIPAYRTWVSDNKEHSTIHNYFLLVTIEQGVPGLIFFLLLTTAMLYYAQSLYHRAGDIFYKRLALVTGVVSMMILTVNFLSDLIETDKVGSLFFLCMALLVITDNKTNSPASTSSA
jgi:O-antigen ligase